MQAIALNAVVRLFKPGVGVMEGAHADFLPGETYAETDAVFKLERRAQVVVFQLGAAKSGNADTGFDIGFDALASKLVDEHRAEREAVVARGFVTVPVGVRSIPIASQATDITGKPALVEIKLGAQAIGHGRVARLANRHTQIHRLHCTDLPPSQGCQSSQSHDFSHGNNPYPPK